MNSKFRKFKVVQILESPYNLNEKVSDFDEIWCTAAYFVLYDMHMTKYINF